MKTNVALELIAANPRADKVSVPAGPDQQNRVASRSLDCLARAIRADATSDSITYVLRSDTGHDGE